MGEDRDKGNSFQFISITNLAEAKDRDKRQQARSHAARQGRQRSQHVSPRDEAGASGQSLNPWSIFAPVSAYGPFETLIGDSPKLRALLSHDAARQAAEPIFSVADPVVFQDFVSVFRTDLNDPALLNAVKLTFAFAVTGGNIDQECLDYQNQAMSTIRERMDSLESALSLPTLGAILLLAGVEARLGMRWQVQLHMGAIQQLLELGQTKTIYLTDGIKRAIFWQDLNSSVMTGSDRIMDHTTFAELQWRRDPFASAYFSLAPGFQRKSHLFDENFLEVLKDIHALQCVQDLPRYSCQNPVEMLRVDNQQASIGSRLVDLPKLSTTMEACYLAAYLSACMLCCKVWRHSVMPSHVSSRLLKKLQESNEDPFWNDNLDLFIWMLYMGGAFSPRGIVHSEYKALLKTNHESKFKGMYRSLDDLMGILQEFIWSEKAYLEHRIGMPGLSRFRGTDDHTATPMMKEYYSQRSQIPGTLIITEAGIISPGAGGYPNAPGLWREDQVEAWKSITAQVHRNGSFIIAQMFHVGRAAVPEIAEKERIEIVSSSAIPHGPDAAVPRELSVDEIKQIVKDFQTAANNAIRAGFDDVSNTRTDEYGGSIENRSRFAYEVMKAVSDAIGPQRVGIRFSPWSTFQGMRMEDPIPQFSDVISKAKELGLAYIHLIEPRVANSDDLEHPIVESLDFAINLWDGPILLAGGYKPDNVHKTIDEMYPEKDIIVMFGRYFVANPDLAFRIKHSLQLNPYDRSTFYAVKNPKGYLDYPFSPEFEANTRA
ncbi:hypothetical protein ACQKWADRAFT_321651 [Trichoderma austrokoningii]